MSANPTKKKKSLFGIDDKESCAKAIRSGATLALFLAVCAAVVASLGLFLEAEKSSTLAYAMDPWNLIDAGLVAVLAIFVFRKSRVASTLLLVYFACGKILMWIELGRPDGIILSVLVFLCYINTMRATYLWHSKYGLAPDGPLATQAD